VVEDELVAAIAQLTHRKDSRVTVGIGDDAAAWQPSRSHRSVITTDALVENVHFSLEWMSREDAGWRAMAANASDVAAMGARPRLTTIAFGVPPGARSHDILEWYRGMDACARTYGLEIAGGDLTRAPVWTIAITAIGEVRPSNLKLRSGARPGDVLAVTGAVGASRAGLFHLRGEIELDEPDRSGAIRAHRRPVARVEEGLWLAASANVHAMMDCSDGISTDVARLALASKAGAVIDTVPVDASAAAAAQQLGEDATAFALAGGEDFELIVSVAPRAFEHLSNRFQKKFGRPLFRLGTVQADERVVVVKQGREEPLERSGWDHFG
jgi:thiamine-monophosphate kinase